MTILTYYKQIRCPSCFVSMLKGNLAVINLILSKDLFGKS